MDNRVTMYIHIAVVVDVEKFILFDFRDAIASDAARLVSIDSEVFLLSDRFHAVVAYMDCFIAANVFGAVIADLTGFIVVDDVVKVFFGMKKNFFLPFFIFKTQFIKTIAFMGFGFYRHAGFMFGKRVRGLCGAVISASHHNRLVRVAIEIFHQHFITDSRYHLAAVVRTGKIL